MYESVKMINPIELIEEVRRRPQLYDSRTSCISTEMRRNTWYEVSEIFIDKFKQMSRIEKENISREIQAKWKALRDSYRRTVRIQERDKQLGLEPSRRSKYYYFDQLNFLAEHCGPKSKKSSQTSEFKMEEDETMENSNDFSAEESTTWEKNPLEESESVEIKIEPQPSEMSMFMENFENSPRKRSEESDELNQRLVSVLEEMVALQRPDKEDVMGDKGFLLSLLPFMQKLSNEENLRVRIEFMKVLQNNGSRKKN